MTPCLRGFFCVLAISSLSLNAAERPFAIRVVDDQTGRGVPLVELSTVNDIVYVTDSNGLAAFDEPGLMNAEVFFYVKSHGYEYPKDGFGYRGKKLKVAPGGEATLKIRRVNIAQRLYRVTGGGIYRDTLLLGRAAPIREPLVNARQLGSDSVQTAIYQGKLYWFWGDTNVPRYPLGIFTSPGATSELPNAGGLEPRVGVNLNYFVDAKGTVRGTAAMRGDGPTWIGGVAALRDAGDCPDFRPPAQRDSENGPAPLNSRKERLVCSFAKIRPPLDTYRRGLAVFDDEAGEFRELQEVDLAAPIFPFGHPIKLRAADADWLYLGLTHPVMRVKATFADWQDTSHYEAFTCLTSGSRKQRPTFDRDAQGRLRYGWRRDAPPLDFELQEQLQKAGLLKPGEGLCQLRERDSGKIVKPGYGSVYWNAYRRRWIMIFAQVGGASLLGETWCAEADTPLGPWAYAVKILTHDNYSFYNPKQHPQFDADGGRTIFFEGTYTRTFSGTKIGTPRYDYNQIMHQLDLEDPRLALPAPIYAASDMRGARFVRGAARRPTDAPAKLAFFAFDRPAPGAVAVYETSDGQGRPMLNTAQGTALEGDRPIFAARKSGPSPAPVFFALRADMKDPPPATVPLYRQTSASGSVAFTTDAPPAGAQATVVCLVWKNPFTVQIDEFCELQTKPVAP